MMIAFFSKKVKNKPFTYAIIPISLYIHLFLTPIYSINGHHKSLSSSDIINGSKIVPFKEFGMQEGESNQSSEKKVLILNNQLNELKKHYSTLQNQFSQQEDEMKELKSKVSLSEVVEQESRSLLQQNKILIRSLEESKDQNEILQEENKSLQEEVKDLKNAYKVLEKDILPVTNNNVTRSRGGGMGSQVSKMTLIQESAKKETQEKVMNKLTLELQNSQYMNQSLHNNLNKLTEENDNLEEDLGEVLELLSNKDEHTNRLTNENKVLKNQLKEATKLQNVNSNMSEEEIKKFHIKRQKTYDTTQDPMISPSFSNRRSYDLSDGLVILNQLNRESYKELSPALEKKDQAIQVNNIKRQSSGYFYVVSSNKNLRGPLVLLGLYAMIITSTYLIKKRKEKQKDINN